MSPKESNAQTRHDVMSEMIYSMILETTEDQKHHSDGIKLTLRRVSSVVDHAKLLQKEHRSTISHEPPTVR